MSAAIRGEPATAFATDRRQFVFGGVLLAASAATAAIAPRRTVDTLAAGALDRIVPDTLGPWRFASQSGLVLPPQDDLSQRIYDQVLTRVYVAGSLPDMMLLIAYGSTQDSGLQLHRPETCYPGAGYVLGERSTPALTGMGDPAAHATYLTATRGDRTEQILYWTRIGREFPLSEWDEKVAILRENLHRALPDGVLVRVSTISPAREAMLPTIERFNASLVAGLGSEGRRILLGRGAV